MVRCRGHGRRPVRVSLWLLKEQRDDRQADKEEKKAAQARQVSIWADGVEDNGTNFIVSDIAQNASGDPIYQVDARLAHGDPGHLYSLSRDDGPRRATASPDHGRAFATSGGQVTGDHLRRLQRQDFGTGGAGPAPTEGEAMSMSELRQPEAGAFATLEANPVPQPAATRGASGGYQALT